MTSDRSREEQEAAAAAQEAGRIGGVAGDEGLDPSERPVREAGGGEAEGFEQAEQMLIDHTSHADQQAAHAILHDSGRAEEQNSRHEDGEADRELDPEGFDRTERRCDD